MYQFDRVILCLKLLSRLFFFSLSRRPHSPTMSSSSSSADAHAGLSQEAANSHGLISVQAPGEQRTAQRSAAQRTRRR